MVLRSLNLPIEWDEQVRALAFALRRPKSDLMRYFVGMGLHFLVRQLKEDPSEERIRKVLSQFEHFNFNANEGAASERDLSRIHEAALRIERQAAPQVRRDRQQE